ncbi:MAG: hypothetical protein H6Q75_567 [Firmicutes bacterium]|nr:hypothetical protein [Bacillota bacterium]
MLVLPVANGILPHADGGQVTGVISVGEEKISAKPGQDVLICAWEETTGLYPVGVFARMLHIWSQPACGPNGEELSVVMAVLEGRGYARWNSLSTYGMQIYSPDMEAMNLKALRKEYPTVSGAGWIPNGGFTEFRDTTDISVTIYGNTFEGKKVSIQANLGGLVSEELAHTVEHGMIRALRTYGLCTPRTLQTEMAKETAELKQSVEWSMRFAMPEMIGRTSTGACGNPMSHLAQFYLNRKLIENLTAGKSVSQSLTDARRSAMSRLTDELGLTTNNGIRVLEGLKKGMRHDDTQLKLDILKRIIIKFPFQP